MNKEGFKKLCQPVKEDLFVWLHKQLSEYYGKANTVNGGDYLFFQGNCPTMLCAHLDTVHKRQPTKIIDDGVRVSSPQGIGGDDRCGVYAVLAILKAVEGEGKKPHVFFSTDEEVGGASTKRAAQEIKNRVAGVGYMIQIDRRNSVDSVYYKCGNTKFKEFIDAHGFIEAQGSKTDICNLSPVFDLASVNLSSGYYNEHTTNEYVVYDELRVTIDKIVKIIADTKDDVVYTYCENKPQQSKSLPYYMQRFKKGDEVYLKFSSCTTYSQPDFSQRNVPEIIIPAYFPLTVIDTKDDFCLVDFNGKKVWMTSWNLCHDIT